MNVTLATLEAIIDTSGVATRIEARLPVGVRRRQLRVRTLLIAMMLTQADHRPAHLTRVHAALTALPTADQARLGVITDWKTGPHQLTYRQTERTFALVCDALDKQHPTGTQTGLCLPRRRLDLETFSRPPPRGATDCADPEASWGHPIDTFKNADHCCN